MKHKLGARARILLVTLGIVVTGLACLMVYIAHASEGHAVQASAANAKETIAQYKTLRAYYTATILAKVKAKTDLKAGFDHAQHADMIPLPATMIQDLSELSSRDSNGIQIRLYSAFPFPNRKQRVLDDFERDALRYFESNPEGTFVREESTEGRNLVRVAIADRMVAQACVDCHNSRADSPKKDWKLGDVRGVLEVRSPIDAQLAASRSLLVRIAVSAAGGLILASLLISWLVGRFVTHPVQRSIRGLSEVADQNTHASGQVSAAGESLAQLASQQAASLEETSSAVEEISSTVNRNADSARKMDECALDAARQAEASKAALQGMIATMQQLQESSRQVSKVVKTIDEIAFRTNILALNAAVEAARSGEAGAGFAVVAEEVRNLAQRAAECAKETATLIADSVARSNEGGERLDQVVAAMRSISEAVVNISTLSRQVTESSREQAHGIDQVSQSMLQLQKVTERTASTAEQNAAAGQELNQQIDESRDITVQLEELVVGSR